MKLLLYCTKSKPYITRGNDGSVYLSCVISDGIKEWHLNGKIVAECDFEVEEIEKVYGTHHASFDENGYFDDYYDYMTKTIDEDILLKRSCLNVEELETYNPNYAIHIKNLHIFDEPRELNFYMVYDKSYDNMFGWAFEEEEKYKPLTKAPQNMMKVCEWDVEDKILISIRPQWLCKILNGEKTIEVRKKVLRGMIK